MKTSPILRPDGTLLAFEIPIPFTRWGWVRFLRTIEGVSDVKEPWGVTTADPRGQATPVIGRA